MLFVLILTSQLNAQWVKVFQRNNISVYQKPDENGLCGYKAETIINVSIDSLYSFFLDFDHYPKWINYCSTADVIDSVQDSLYIYYAYFDMPWPARNRDAISMLKIAKDSQRIIVNSQPAKVDYRHKMNTIRVTQFEEKYELIEISKSKTSIVMQGAYDPGGMIPDWVIRKMLKYGPYDILIKVKSMVESK